MVTGGDPRPLDHSQITERFEHLYRVADSKGFVTHATDEEPEDTPEAVRARGIQEWRDHQWRKVIPPAFVSATLDDVDVHGAAGTAVRSWTVRSGPHPNLVILGPTGVGKSHAAIAALRPAHESGLSVGFYSLPRLLRDLSPGADHQMATIDAACNTTRMVLDDFGVERRTEWVEEQLFHVVNERILRENPTIATSNLDLDHFVEWVGPRVASRLLGGATIVTLTGPDRRRVR